MKGLELSRNYYELYGRHMLKQKFPKLFERMAIGLAGEGSECFGFDDDYSRDHDFGPSFCIWLEGPDYLQCGREVQNVYDALPGTFGDYPARTVTAHGKGRVGVLCTQVWYARYTGFAKGPRTPEEWLRTPEFSLATAVNGEVFHDPAGRFTEIREYLKQGYPEDIRLKRIAARASTMAQAGQYNYMRCLKRGDGIAAGLALAEFVRAGLSMLYLLNRTYAPYYKWLYRGARELKILPRACGLFGRLTEAGDGEEKAELIERICLLVGGELRRQGLSEETDPFLEAHCGQILDHIQEQRIRNMPVMIW